MEAAAGRHQPAKPQVRRQRRLHQRGTGVRTPARDGELVREDRAGHLHDIVAQVPRQFTERRPGALDASVLQRSQLGQATILRRTFLPDAARLSPAEVHAPAIQPGAALAESHPRRVQEVRACSAVGHVLAAPDGGQAEGQAAP